MKDPRVIAEMAKAGYEAAIKHYGGWPEGQHSWASQSAGVHASWIEVAIQMIDVYEKSLPQAVVRNGDQSVLK